MYNIYFLWFPIVFAYVNISALPFSKKKEKTVSSNFTLQEASVIM